MLATFPTINCGGDHENICMILEHTAYTAFLTGATQFVALAWPPSVPMKLTDCTRFQNKSNLWSNIKISRLPHSNTIQDHQHDQLQMAQESLLQNCRIHTLSLIKMLTSLPMMQPWTMSTFKNHPHYGLCLKPHWESCQQLWYVSKYWLLLLS